MSKRNHDLHLRLNDAEFEKLNRLVTQSGLSRESYIRQIISGLQPRNQPPPDYHSMMRQLFYCGNNLNQIARKAHGLGVIDGQKYDEAVLEFRSIIKQLNKAILEPEKLSHGNDKNMGN